MTEVIVFLIVGSISITSAALMLMSENAVHSALFLVLNFMTVAFFFLTLGAPFIALVQITVYAGAIMVLFLFVIMLLGAERIGPSSGPGPFRWLPRTAIVLALVFLITVGAAIASGEINLQTPPPTLPQARFLHAADAPPVDVYLNNQLFAEDVDFAEATAYQAMPAGEYGVTVFPAGADPTSEAPAMLGELILTEADAVSLVALGGNGAFRLTSLLEELTPAEDEAARLTLLNGMPELGPVNLVDTGFESDETDSTVLINRAAFGETVETLTLDPVDDLTLELVPADDEDEEAVMTFSRVDLARATNTLLVAAPETLADGQLRIAPLVFATPAQPLYGSPQAVGATLFSKYLLPFELVSVLLLVAMVGAIVLSRKELIREAAPRRRVVRRPLVGPGVASADAAESEAGK